VTRRFPPSVGGMETLAADVWTALDRRCPGARLVAHGGTNRGLPWFLLTAWARVAALVVRRRVDVVMCYDAATYIALWPLLTLLRVPRIALVNGLDLTWSRAPYRRLLTSALPRASRVLAISRATAAVARDLGVPEAQVSVVRLSVDAPIVSAADREDARTAVHERLALDPDAVVLFTIGRLVARKGVRWFVDSVLPALSGTAVHYAIAGSGSEQLAIEDAVAAHGLTGRVHLLGPVSDAERETLLRGVDLFVQPNVVTPGDMEGFGLVLVEAAKRGTPVVASALEGMTDAVADGEAGVLCPPGDVAAWRATVQRLVDDPAARTELARRGTERAWELFSVETFGAQLEDELAIAVGSGPAR
jgi:phosphatidylinositol alpha-1,6-mannosyltransferase